MKILYILLIAFLLTCTKEYSGEGTPVAPVDTIQVVDTLRDYYIDYDILITDNNAMSHLEPAVKTKYRTWYRFTALVKTEGVDTFRYVGRLDVNDPMSLIETGDTALFRFEKVYPGPRFVELPRVDTVIK